MFVALRETGKFLEIFLGNRRIWPEFRCTPLMPMEPKMPEVSGKPISVGLTCWLWERRSRAIIDLARRLGVTVKLTQHIRGLRRDIDCQVSGKNVDRFIGEFVRHC
jgi:hypothetical protein